MPLKALTLILFSLAAFLCQAQLSEGKDDPVIGILTLPAAGWDGYTADKWNYFASSYVKFIESAGAQVVPIHWDQPLHQIDALLDRINGVLFTGGGASMGSDTRVTPIYLVYQHIVKYVLEKNHNGTYYPLWGTCLGFEAISRVLANNISILSPCADCQWVNKNNYANPNYESRILKNLTDDLREKMKSGNLSLFEHKYKVSPQVYEENPTLGGNLTIVAYSADANSEKYVSMFESPSLPIYGTQFHQEKSNFEWRSNLNLRHGYDAVRFSQYLANFFVRETRKNNHHFPDNSTYLIYNYKTTIVTGSNFTEMYLFPKYEPHQDHHAKIHQLTPEELATLNQARMPGEESVESKVPEKEEWSNFLTDFGTGFLRRIDQ